MDLLYDHIQEKALTPDEDSKKVEKETENTLNSDFQEAYKVISSSPWGIKIGGLLGNFVKQSGEVYKEAQKELSEVSEEATRGLTGLRSSIISRTGDFSLRNLTSGAPGEASDGENKSQTENENNDSEGVLARLKFEATKRLKEIERAEDAADEALLRFGSNIRNFLRDAVTIAPPSTLSDTECGTVVFESKDATGKRIIHTTRFDAQLHAIHTCLDSFTKDPISDEYESWKRSFSVEEKTEDISKYLKTYPELRVSMEKLVPDMISYADFWTRYHFLKYTIETAEARRKDLLKGAVASTEEDVGWDEESDNENEVEATTIRGPASAESSTTLHPKSKTTEQKHLKPEESRKSQDGKSVADSEASYDVVGTASATAPGSPLDMHVADESEEDW
ncbi:hypothetical protein EPUL_004730, partial [Erysiphe pulchra]